MCRKARKFNLFVFLLILLCIFQNSYANSEDKRLLPIVENDLWGFIDTKGNIVIKPQFKYLLSDFQDGLALVQLTIPIFPTDRGKIDIPPTKFGFINKKGEIVLEVFANSIRPFDKGIAVIQRGSFYDGKYYNYGKYGFIDKSGKTFVEPRFDGIYGFSEDLAAVKISKKWGFIDRSGKIVIKPEFEDVDNFSEGLAAVKVRGKWGYIDKTGKLVIKPQFKGAGKFQDRMARIKLKMYGDYGYIDRSGEIVVPTKYNDASYFYYGKASVKLFKKNKSIPLCINKKDEKLPLKDCEKTPREYPVFKFSKNTGQETFIKGYFVNEDDEVVFENKWDGYAGFSDGVALVYQHNKDRHWCGLHVPGWTGIYDMCAFWGYIDNTGKYIWKQAELE